jgi:RimJ/RimL family protein N-acetyltransferase
MFARPRMIAQDHGAASRRQNGVMNEPNPKPFPELETPRLLLREIGPSDAPALFAIHGDADVMRWFGFDPLPDLSAAHNLIKVFDSWRRQPNPGTRWGIQVKGGDPVLIGTCMTAMFSLHARSALGLGW